MISYGTLSRGNSVGFTSGKSLRNSETGSYITRVDNALVTIGSGPTSLKGSMLSLSESFSSISDSSVSV